MTRAVMLSFAAGGAAVLGAWDALAAVEGTRVAARLARVLEPLLRAQLEGRPPTRPERRRLALLAGGVLLAAGWLVGGVAVAVGAALAGPLLVVAVVRARRRRHTPEPRPGAPAAAPGLAAAPARGHPAPGA